VGLLVAALILILQARRLYFFGDEWAFVLHRDLTLDGLLRPHNEHWSTVPVLFYRVLFHVVGIDHHLVYAMGAITLHITAALLSFVVMRRNTIAAWPAVIAALLLAFCAGGIAENPLWAFQAGFLGSAVAGLLALALESARPPSRLGTVLVWVLVVLSMMCSGMAFPMLIWLSCYVLLTRGVLPALWTAVPPVLVYAVWYLGYGHDAVATAPPAGVDDVLRFASTGLARVWGEVIRLPGTGGVALLVLAFVALLVPASERARALARSGVVAVVLTYLLVGHSRAGLGLDAAGAGRYAWFGILFTLPAFALLLQVVGERVHRRESVVVAAILLVFLAVSGTTQSLAFTHQRERMNEGLEPRVLAASELARDGDQFLNGAVSPKYNPDIDAESLRRPDVVAALPDAEPSEQALLDVAATMQVGSSAKPYGLGPPAQLEGRHLQGSLPTSGCADLTASAGALLELSPDSEVQLTSKADTYRVWLLRNGLRSQPAKLPAEPGHPTYVGTIAPDAVLHIALKPGPVRVCV
jgi:hypothetical protein